MRTVSLVKEAGTDNNGKHYHWLKLECGHIVTPIWNRRTFYHVGKTKARCYECGVIAMEIKSSYQDYCCVCGKLVWYPEDALEWEIKGDKVLACSTHTYREVWNAVGDSSDEGTGE